jgi:hypothetical protein
VCRYNLVTFVLCSVPMTIFFAPLAPVPNLNFFARNQVAEKPSIAKSIAALLSGGMHSTVSVVVFFLPHSFFPGFAIVACCHLLLHPGSFTPNPVGSDTRSLDLPYRQCDIRSACGTVKNSRSCLGWGGRCSRRRFDLSTRRGGEDVASLNGTRCTTDSSFLAFPRCAVSSAVRGVARVSPSFRRNRSPGTTLCTNSTAAYPETLGTQRSTSHRQVVGS